MATPIPSNWAPFTVEEIARATGGRVLRDGMATLGVGTDSRAATPGSMFVALTGERFDGHEFLQEAADRGASTFVVSRPVTTPPGAAAILVSDTRAALGQLAHAHRARWAAAAEAEPRRVVGITGSAGKTTTKNVLAAILEAIAPGSVHASAGNLNNAIGLPMTLLGLEPRHRMAVLELGTSARGEIAALARIARPDVGVLTLVAAAHTEHLGSLDDVATEKGALLEALPPAGLAVVNADDARASRQLERTAAQQIRLYGLGAAADYRVVARRPERDGSHVVLQRGGEQLALESPLLGDAGALALAGALAVAEWINVGPIGARIVTDALASLRGLSEGRLAVIELPDGTLLIDDSYNANPASMRSSIATAGELARSRGRALVLVLGEMRELGAIAEEAHRALAAAVHEEAPRQVVVVGQAALPLAEELRGRGMQVAFVANAEEAETLTAAAVRPGEVVLVKGSRGVHTERVVVALRRARALEGSRA